MFGKTEKQKSLWILLGVLLVALGLLFVYRATRPADPPADPSVVSTDTSGTVLPSSGDPIVDLSDLPAYSGDAFVALNGNTPGFTAAEKKDAKKSFETYGEQDELGRCTTCVASVGTDLMPTEERGSISSVKPTGWKSVQYDIVDGKSLYNRCHLIGFQLTGENANRKNLVTGTRYMNTVGMLPFENMVADYVRETENHVLYRVTPIFDGEELVPRGVEMEAWSVEDDGDGVCYHVYCYNVQPGIEIDYATGDSRLLPVENKGDVQTFVLNTSSRKYHLPSCPLAKDIKDKNKDTYTGTKEMLEAQGYVPCGSCHP